MSTNTSKKTDSDYVDWHSGFEGGLRLSLRKYEADIDIEREHPLSMEPLKIDFLVLKKKADVVIDNSIGRSFKKHNIIEYKNPNDELNIDVVWKAIGYAGIYKSQSRTVNEIDQDDLTISIFRVRKPQKLLRYLNDKGYNINNSTPGIYQIIGLIDVPLSIVVMKELDDAEVRCLKIMTHNALDVDIKAFLDETKSYTTAADKRYANAVLQVSTKVNKSLYNILKGDNAMSNALRELMADELKEAEDKGENKINSLYSWLFDLGRGSDVERGSKDPVFLKKLLKEYEKAHATEK